MAVRTPLYRNVGNNLLAMSDDDMNNTLTKTINLYGNAPTNTIALVTNGTGNMTSMKDTRYTSGTYTRNATGTPAVPDSGTTATQELIAATFNKLLYQVNGAPAPADTNLRAFPVYYDNGNLRAMTLDDMIDTYGKPAASILGDPEEDGGYFISTDAALSSAYTRIGSGVAFRDTTFNTGLTTAQIQALVGTANYIDNSQTITNYYLYQVKSGSGTYGTAASIRNPVYIRSDGDLQEYTTSQWESLLQQIVRYTTVSVSGYRIQYAVEDFLNSSYSSNAAADAASVGNLAGSRMIDREVLNSTIFARKINNDDYRRQRFPTGSSTVKTRYYLTIRNY